MSAQSNLKVFCFLRILECLMSAVCFGIHIYGVFNIEETFKHEVIFCGTYLGFILVSAFAAINHCSQFFKYHIEIISAACGFVLFMATSIWSMVIVEQDEKLQTMSEKDEHEYFFFQINRLQSVASLATAFIFLLHTMFAVDFVTTTDDVDEIISDRESTELKLFFFPEQMWNALKEKFA